MDLMPKTFLVGFYRSGHLFESKSIHDMRKIRSRKKLSNLLHGDEG